MPTKRQKPIEPYFQKILESKGFEELKPFARHYGINEGSVYSLAQGSGKKFLQRHLEIAKALDIPFEEYVKGYLEVS